MSELQDAFTNIYRTHSWRSSSRSGPGSEPKNTKSHRDVIEKLLRYHSIKTVVDVGCGDWASSKMVD